MNTYFHIFQHPVFDAIGSALLHSLWQAAVVAGLLFLALRIIRNEASELRYMLCCAALLLIVLLPVATAVQLYISNPVAANNGLVSSVTAERIYDASELPAEPLAPATGGAAERPPASSTPPMINSPTVTSSPFPWQPLVVMLWLAGIVLMSLKWGQGALTARRLRNSGIDVYEKEVEQVFCSLMHLIGIKKPVRLCASLHIDQPMMIGWFKPVVLLPVSMLTAMPLDQVEAILAHELAHIRRHDYLVLILQTAAETLFFYHPAVWFVSRCMTIEREYCCDTMATDLIGNDLAYASALASLAQTRSAKGAHALGANDGRLVDRIRRIVDRNQGVGSSRRSFSGWGAGLVLFGCVVLLAACLHGVKEQEGEASEESGSIVLVSGSPDELYNRAMEALETQDIVTARDFAEEAGNEGHMCSCLLLSHIYDPDKGRRYKNGMYEEAIVWGQESDSMQVYWGKQFTKAVKREAEAGNALAMLWLHMGYANPSMGLFSEIEQSDSLATVWFERALEANNPHAWRRKAESTMKEGNVEEADALFLKAAELGDEAAFLRWTYADTARVVQPDPNRYFMIADLAIKHDAPGTRAFLGETITTLKEQVDLGNEYAMQWLTIAEQMNIPERIEALPDTPEPHWVPEFLTLCNWEKDAYFSWFF